MSQKAKEIVAEAMRLVAEKRAQGWTREDFAEALRQMLMPEEEVVIKLANGWELRSGWIDHDDPDACLAGDYLKLLDAEGRELLHLGADEWMHPVTGRLRLSAFLCTCAGLRQPTSPPGHS